MKFNKLTPKEKAVILDKQTEPPKTGEYNDFFSPGFYLCKYCNTPLFSSNSKFRSDCGWPSFDDQISGAVKKVPDNDGRRVEIICSRCGGHLGHIFEGENFTPKNIRYCVNSISLNFQPSKI